MTLDSSGKLKLYSSISVLTILAVICIALIVPKAEIVISLKERQFKKTYSVILDSTISAPLIPINRIPYAVKKEHIIAFINGKIAGEIGAKTEQFDESALRYALEMTDQEHGIATLYIESVILPKIDTDALKKSIRGQKIKEARDYLARLPYIKSVTLAVSPEFIPFIPLIAERINITAISQ